MLDVSSSGLSRDFSAQFDAVTDFSTAVQKSSSLIDQNFALKNNIINPVAQKISVYKAQHDLRQTYREFERSGFTHNISVDTKQLNTLYDQSQEAFDFLRGNNAVRAKDRERAEQIGYQHHLFNHLQLPYDRDFPAITYSSRFLYDALPAYKAVEAW